MKQFKTVWLSIIFLGLLPLAWAEGEDAVATIASDGASSDSHKMLRQTNDVKGYQSLSVAGQDIDSAYLEETLGEQYGAIILIHDQGEQFESQGVITPLRHDLLEYGWSTLSLSFDYPYEPNILLSMSEGMLGEQVDSSAATPAPGPKVDSLDANTSTLPPVSNQERIQTALAFLQAKGVERIVFIGHGAGGDMAIELLDTIKTPISALILVGSTALPKNDIFNAFNFPIFDVYGSNDLEQVPAAVQHRKIAMKRIGNTRYQSRRIVGADHLFSGLQATLTATVSGWLRTKFVEQADN
ncbi:MAG: DUF3530 family protein [Gammaproteobacteria bacterium]|nr:DUF3530 family protein [Gammaproteobacteria bacterium]